MSKTLIQNGATERIELLALDSAGSGVTGDAANISISIRNNANGETFNGTVFAAGANVVNPTETDLTNRPGQYHYDFTSPTNDISVSIYAVSSTASVISDPWGPDVLQIGGLPSNFEDLAITSSDGYVTVGTNEDKTDYSISGTIQTLDALDTALDSAHGAGSWEGAGSAPTAAQVADAVWDEAIADHVAAGSTGLALSTASSGGVDVNVLRDAIWNAILSNYDTPDSAGLVLSNTASVGTINAAITLLLEAIEDSEASSTPCGSLASGTVTFVPNLYVGHKGETILLRAYRNGIPMTDTELVGADDLEITFKNKNGAQHFSIDAGISIITGGYLSYTSVSGDGVDEAAGTWEAQGSGTTAGDDHFETQIQIRKVHAIVPDAP